MEKQNKRGVPRKDTSSDDGPDRWRYIKKTGPRCMMRFGVLTLLVTLLTTLNNSAIAQGNVGYASFGEAQSAWVEKMLYHGRQHCNKFVQTRTFDEHLAATYYDADRIFTQIGDFTGDRSWYRCANYARAVYRDQYVLPNNGAVPGYWNFSEGLLLNYLKSRAAKSRNAVLKLATNAAFAVDGTPASSTVAPELSREVAYTIEAYINAELAGAPVRSRKTLLVNQALGHIDAWVVNRTAQYVRPFMVALTAEALIKHHERTNDARVLPKIKLAADWLWTNMWIPSQGSFKYTDRNHSTGGMEPAPDLNLLIAPMYGWLWKMTHDVKYRDRGDAIFGGGVKQAYLVGDKQFNQSYRWSFDYLKWRAQ